MLPQVTPKSGRIVVFDADIPHRTGLPDSECHAFPCPMHADLTAGRVRRRLLRTADHFGSQIYANSSNRYLVWIQVDSILVNTLKLVFSEASKMILTIRSPTVLRIYTHGGL